jgi:hypothetical protein
MIGPIGLINAVPNTERAVRRSCLAGRFRQKGPAKSGRNSTRIQAL